MRRIVLLAMLALLACSPAVTAESKSIAPPEVIKNVDTLIGQNKFEEAKAALTAQLKETPNDPYCLSRRGAVNNQLGNFKQCRDDLIRAFAVTHDGRDLETPYGYLIMRAFANMKLKNKKEAYADIERVGKAQPTNGQYLHIRGQIEETFGSPTEALKLYEKSLAIDPSNNICLGHANEVATKLKLDARKEKLINDCIRRSPNTFNLMCRAHFNGERGKWKEVVEDCRRCIQLEPHQTQDPTPYRLLCRGLVTLLKAQQANTETTKALKIFPNDPEIMYDRAMALYWLNKDNAAIAICNDLIKKNPRMAEPYEVMGQIYKRQKRYEQSAEQFKKGAAIHDPLSVIVLTERANAYKCAELYKEAAQDFEKIFSVLQTGSDLLRAGECYIGLSEYRNAMKVIQRGLDPKVKNPMSQADRLHALNRLSLCYARLKDPKKAKEIAAQVLTIDPDSTSALHLHAESCLFLKDYDGAIKDVTRLIKLQPNLVLNYTERAKLYKLKGENALAKKDLETATKFSSIVESETFPTRSPAKRK